MHIAIIWQRFLSYHVARLRHLKARCDCGGHRLTAIEVASADSSYGFDPSPGETGHVRVCCFPDDSYHNHTAGKVHAKVLSTLSSLMPDVVFAPATPFPEGMAAVLYGLKYDRKVVLMDDAWELTARRGVFTKTIKIMIHRCIDAAFVPAPSHLPYFRDMAFPAGRVVFGVDVVDNDYFSLKAAESAAGEPAMRSLYSLPADYFLFVGRFLKRKGIETMLDAYRLYRRHVDGQPWDLVLVGNGMIHQSVKQGGNSTLGVHFPGLLQGDELCHHYGLAKALIVPSISDPWGLVVNEGMAAGLPVIVSRGCGAAGTLVSEGENGWTYEPGDVTALADLMSRISGAGSEQRRCMGLRSREIIAEWSLERFAQGVIDALEIPKRRPAGIVSRMLARAWKGRIQLT